MKRIGLALIALTFAVASLQAQKANQPETPFAVHAELFAWPFSAQNITSAKTFTVATYTGSQAVIYKAGGASVVTAKIPQTEIEGQTVEVEGGALLCSNPETGDYLKLNPLTGVAEVKVAGRYFVLTP